MMSRCLPERKRDQMQRQHFICEAPALNSGASRRDSLIESLVYRTASIQRGAIDKEERTVEFSAASETPVQRHNGDEVLEISDKAIVWDRLRNAAPLLVQHDMARQVGVIERAWLSARKLYVRARFSRSGEGETEFRDVVDGIRRNVSIGYLVHNQERTKDGFRVIRWEPMEVSLVSVPADFSVGIGRAASFEHRSSTAHHLNATPGSSLIELRKICWVNGELMLPGRRLGVDRATAMAAATLGSASILRN